VPAQGRLASSASHRSQHSFERRLACDDVPDPESFVVTAADKLRTVGAETDTMDIVRVPSQGRHALTRLRVPDLDALVMASTCDVLPVWAPNDGADPAVSDQMIQHRKQLRQGKKIRQKKKSHKSECPLSVDWQEPVDVSQILILLSSLQLASSLPYGQKQTLETFL
jgi:hypothetical protein